MGARHHPGLQTSVSSCLGHTEPPQISLRMKQVTFFWDHPPLLPHRPWWQHPLQIVTFLLREFEGLRSSTLPQGLFQNFILSLPRATPSSWLVLFLLGNEPISFLVLQSSFFFFFLPQQGLVVAMTGPSKQRKPEFQGMFCDLFLLLGHTQSLTV